MKWTRSLIRINEHEVEVLRKRLGEIVARRAACEAHLVRLAEEAVAETTRARQDAEAGWYLVGFHEGWKLRKERAMAELSAIQHEEQGARDALARAYEELKKVEQVAETARVAAVKAQDRRDAQALDELALRRAAK
jgi:flagellar FliJ protein